MSTMAAMTDKLASAIENAEALDPLAKAIQGVYAKVLRYAPLRSLASGTPLGHPFHPLLVAIPIGSWSSALVFDALGDDRAAQTAIGAGLVVAVPTAFTGGSDWSYTAGAERRIGLVHALCNGAAIWSYAMSWVARRRNRRGVGVVLSLTGMGLISAGGWLGGHLSYALGVGVDTTAFQQVPEGWHDVAEDSDVVTGAVTRVDLQGISVMLTRTTSGQVVAYADRCTHRGGALSEGALVDGCVQCPLHASVFSLDDGHVVQGPATRPQPKFNVRIVDGRVAVSRPDDQRSLRKNPVGH